MLSGAALGERVGFMRALNGPMRAVSAHEHLFPNAGGTRGV
jgi:hypothetical protein